MSLPDLDFHYRRGNNITTPTCRVGISTIDIGPDDCLTIPCFHHHTKKIKINGRLYSLFNSYEWKQLFKEAGRYPFCKNCTIDCYFGLFYWDKLGRYFIKQNLTFFKNVIERFSFR